jgi:hypothetical protein
MARVHSSCSAPNEELTDTLAIMGGFGGIMTVANETTTEHFYVVSGVGTDEIGNASCRRPSGYMSNG